MLFHTKPVAMTWKLTLIGFGLIGVISCGNPNVPVTQPPPDAFRVSSPRPPRVDLYPTPPVRFTPLPLSSLGELTAQFFDVPWPLIPEWSATRFFFLSAQVLGIEVPENVWATQYPPPSPIPSPQPDTK